MDEPKGLFQLSVSVVNLQTKHPRNAGLGHDLQEYSNEVFLSLASAGGPLGDVTVARSRELWPGPCDHFHPVQGVTNQHNTWQGDGSTQKSVLQKAGALPAKISTNEAV